MSKIEEPFELEIGDRQQANGKVSKSKDSNLKAVLFINLQCIFINLGSAVWKQAHRNFGLRLIDFFFFRNFCYLSVSYAFLFWLNQNPFS